MPQLAVLSAALVHPRSASLAEVDATADPPMPLITASRSGKGLGPKSVLVLIESMMSVRNPLRRNERKSSPILSCLTRWSKCFCTAIASRCVTPCTPARRMHVPPPVSHVAFDDMYSDSSHRRARLNALALLCGYARCQAGVSRGIVIHRAGQILENGETWFCARRQRTLDLIEYAKRFSNQKRIRAASSSSSKRLRYFLRDRVFLRAGLAPLTPLSTGPPCLKSSRSRVVVQTPSSASQANSVFTELRRELDNDVRAPMSSPPGISASERTIWGSSWQSCSLRFALT